MNSEFWTTLLNSPVMAAIVEAALVCFCILRLQSKKNKELEEEKALIQHDCDIRLERYRLEFNQLLSEHQTRFKYWHDEKAKAIKELYADASELYADLNYLQSVETDPVWRMDKNNQEQARNDFRNQAVLCMKKTVEDWSKLRLFLESNEDNLFAELNIKTGLWFNVLLNPDPEQRLKFLENNREEMQKDIDGVMDKLRTSFREALYVATKEASQNTVNPSSNSNNQNEAK